MKSIAKKSILGVLIIIFLNGFGVIIHDRVLENEALRALLACTRAEMDGHTELLIQSLYNAKDKVHDFENNAILLHKQYVSKQACWYIKRLTNSDIVKELNIYDRASMFDCLSDIASSARRLHPDKTSVRTDLITRYNNTEEFKAYNNDICDIQNAIIKYPEDLALYDLLCRAYYKKKDFDSVFKYGIQSAEFYGPREYKNDIIFILYLCSCELGRLDDAVSYIGFAKEELDFSILDYEFNDIINIHFYGL